MKVGQEEMRSGQKRMESGQDEMKGMIDEVKGEVQKKIEEVEGKVQMRIEEFGDSHLTQYHRSKLKTRRQKSRESLEVLAADVERLMSLAYTEYFLDVRESLAVQFFVDAIRDEETQLSTRSIETEDDTWKEIDDKFESLLKPLKKLVNSLAAEQNAPQRNPNVTCWKCFKKGHVQRAFQANDAHSGKLTCGCLAERKIPTLNKTPEEGLKVSALSGGGEWTLSGRIDLLHTVFVFGGHKHKYNFFKSRPGP
ncbi:hypothetical protein AVEN_257610-1 [Araneus ventricosus]|uniref:CCHC-type domain-containing protein n=1 Tax=Araneus ventricosus TaxID=182803 RepID=A0A4Y2E3K6_ARAVE|nr:hypothetical protein AVEN_257610-1 [Araneus ventricosus]